jgi:predicted nucleic acid-binding Zn finger protein
MSVAYYASVVSWNPNPCNCIQAISLKVQKKIEKKIEKVDLYYIGRKEMLYTNGAINMYANLP